MWTIRALASKHNTNNSMSNNQPKQWQRTSIKTKCKYTENILYIPLYVTFSPYHSKYYQ